eukprot:TRINITY_DN2714_c4_g1_i1.p1 TRINITY_DN2714_c4_g1~~TRINITY_DN2714_c4_g1_i1.p1  ORF type:complete len:453 (+),score=64.17 TRINITY_DN2714_c4_g1_i1:50-1360(+)
MWWTWVPCSNKCGRVCPPDSDTEICCSVCTSSRWTTRSHCETCCNVQIATVLPAFVSLVAADGGHTYGPFRVDHHRKCGHLYTRLRMLEHKGSDHLAVDWTGRITDKGTITGGDDDWQVLLEINEILPEVCTISLAAVKQFLASVSGRLVSRPSLEDNGTLWSINEIKADDLGGTTPLLHPLRGLLPPRSYLSSDQKLSFKNKGFLQVKRVVPEAVINNALCHINSALCDFGHVEKKKNSGEIYLKHLQCHPSITALLYTSPAWSMAQDLIGRDQVWPVGGGQIALRPPQTEIYQAQENVCKEYKKHWHIDGIDEGLHSSFTLLVGITLTPALNANMGNLLVWPGSHHVLCPLMNKNHYANKALLADCPDIGLPQSVLAQSGDVVFAHQKLAHSGGPNAGHSIRYQVYFRLSHKKHEQLSSHGVTLTDLWVEFEGV